MSIAEILRWSYSVMEYPLALILLAPFAIAIIWLLRKEFIVIKEEPAARLRRKKLRTFIMLSRILIIALLLIAIASPYIKKEKTIDGDPFVQLLIDNSTSMSVFEDYSENLASRLEKKMNVEVKYVGTGTTSNIGDAVLSGLEPYGSVLLLSDANVNNGADLGDVALFAGKINATINAIQLNPVKNDAGVLVFGPAKTLEGSESTFTVLLNRIGTIGELPLKVVLDNEVVYDGTTSQQAFQFTRQLSRGIHKITASINAQDYFSENNVFYKTTKVVSQPKVLFYTEKNSPMETLLRQVYSVDVASSLPAKLDDYYSVVVNDINSNKLNSVSDVLNDYVADGNGIVVFGGENSFEKGNYKNSLFETLLPVMVGSPDKKEGDVLIAILIDVSGSQGTPFGRFASSADFSKAATIGILKGLKLDTRVAIIAFNTQAYLLSEPSPLFSKKGVEDLIGRLKWGGGTNIGAGLLKAVGVLSQYSGSKNIVILSDGKTQSEASAYEAAKLASNSGIKIYTVGVGPSTDEKVMMDLAEITNGIYFRATEETRLKILFGDVDEQEASSGQMELVILNKNHFITENFEPKAALYGFNQVSPKGAARLLATTSGGQPVLTIWRLGLGRVAAYSVDDGNKWAGSLLSKENSKLITKTMNWAIGDPERKSKGFVDAKDTRLRESAEVTIKSELPPEAENVVFYKIDEGYYTASIMPQSAGFQEVAGAAFAVNYESEYENLGTNPELAKITATTGGKIFKHDDIDNIVKHAKTRAKRVITSHDYLRGLFVGLAMIILFLEIFIRRLLR